MKYKHIDGLCGDEESLALKIINGEEMKAFCSVCEFDLSKKEIIASKGKVYPSFIFHNYYTGSGPKLAVPLHIVVCSKCRKKWGKKFKASNFGLCGCGG